MMRQRKKNSAVACIFLAAAAFVFLVCVPPAAADEPLLWWQEEIAPPDEGHIINPEFVRQRQELEQFWLQARRDRKATKQYWRWTKRTHAVGFDNRRAQRTYAVRERELFKIPVYLPKHSDSVSAPAEPVDRSFISDGPFLATGPWPVLPMEESQAFALDQNYRVLWILNDDYAACNGLCKHRARALKVDEESRDWTPLMVSIDATVGTDAAGRKQAYVTLPVESMESGTYMFRVEVIDRAGRLSESGIYYFKVGAIE